MMMMMNTAHLALYSLIIISISICGATTATGKSSSPVVDIEGDEVKAGGHYTMYAVPEYFSGEGGGLSLAKTDEYGCPLAVVQNASEGQPTTGLPLSFHPVDVGEKVVRTSSDLNIKFNASTKCDEDNSTVWQMHFDGFTRRLVVTAGGELGNPGIETENNWFKLEKVRQPFYKLVFCPSVCENCVNICGDLLILGVDIRSSKRRLVMNRDKKSYTKDSAFWVIIHKAKEEDNLMMIRNLKPQA